MRNVFSHASLSLKLKALHSTKVHCKVKVAKEKCFTPRSVVGRKVVVTKSVVFRCARSARKFQSCKSLLAEKVLKVTN